MSSGKSGGETILLVEDEPSLRKTTALLLRRQGYQVIDVSDGVEASAAVKKSTVEIQLLLTDVMLPGGMTGVELAATLGIQRVIFMSGYSPELAGKALESSDLKWFLQKPTEPAVLFDTIRRCLSADAGVSRAG